MSVHASIVRQILKNVYSRSLLGHFYSCTNRALAASIPLQVLDIDSAIAEGEALSSLKLGLESEQVKAIKLLSQGIDLNLQVLIRVLCWWCRHWSL